MCKNKKIKIFSRRQVAKMTSGELAAQMTKSKRNQHLSAAAFQV
jgi:hypothetical protein